jgi:hypothetical protein
MQTTGFFRPLVGISFALQYELFGLNPLPYGLFNLILHLLNILLVFILFKKIGRTSDYALLIAALFAFNSKANRMAVGWISGRTALLYSFFLLLAFIFHIAALKKYNDVKNSGKIKIDQIGFFTIAVVCYFSALLSKESAIAAPLIIFAGTFFCLEKVTRRKRLKRAAVTAALYLPAMLAYFYFRSVSNAFTPANAPDYYRFSLEPLFIIKNFFEYIIRGGLLDLILVAVFLTVSIIFFKAKKIQIESKDIRLMSGGVLFYFVFILIYLPIPHRSDLYSYFTQIGLHLAFAVVIYNLLSFLKDFFKKAKIVSLLFFCAFLAGWIIYIAVKNISIAERGIASMNFSRAVCREAAMLPEKSYIIIYDKDGVSVDSPFNTVSYGFASLLKLYFPLKKMDGMIVNSETQYQEAAGNYRLYYWENGLLKKKK